MNSTPRSLYPCLPAGLGALLLGLAVFPIAAPAQPIATPWGNVDGIVVDGQRMPFETSLRAPDPDWAGVVQSNKYNWEGTQDFTHEGDTYTSAHFLQGTRLDYVTRVTDTGRGAAHVDLHVKLGAPLPMAGAYYCVELPVDIYGGGSFELLGSDGQPLTALPEASGSGKPLLQARATGFRATGHGFTIEVEAAAPTELLVRQDFVDQPAYLNDPAPRMRFVKSDSVLKEAPYQVYFSVLPADAPAGAEADTAYDIHADGPIDHSPVHFTIDPTHPGRAFDGIGGNFRMQFPELDAQVVDYIFDSMHVAWGRVAFLWDEWQPDESHTQAEAILKGNMSPHFRRQLEISRRLAGMGIPVIVSVWNPPAWAVDHSVALPKGVQLDAARMGKIAESIADYLVFLKDHYGLEADLFSFNETDYGVEVHQTPEEHAQAIRALGECFMRRGLKTRLLVGDTGAGTLKAHDMIVPTLADKSLRPYLGAISFHAYHGVTALDLAPWETSAEAANLPILMTEGGPDSAAHRYPLIFQTPWYELQEIDQYVRICRICQAGTIMPWQLNADYSVLAGGGMYGDEGPLRPTMRYWSLRQLDTMRPGSFWIPIETDGADITCAALGDIANNEYAVHIVNNGASRPATITGFPPGVGKVRMVVTDATRGMKTTAERTIVDGEIHFNLEARAYTSVLPAGRE